MAADKLSFLLPQLFYQSSRVSGHSGIENRKPKFVPLPFGLGKYPILVFSGQDHACIVLCHPGEDIDTLPDVDDLPIQKDGIDPCPLKRWRESLVFQGFINVSFQRIFL